MEEKILLITAGLGPLECCRAVYQVQKMLKAQACKLGLVVETVHSVSAAKPNTFHSCVLKFSGMIPDKLINEWQGTVQWIAQSPYRTVCKRKNWFVGIEVLENIAHIKWDESEISYETFRASGPGGQHVNKVESAVRIQHNHTGIQIQVMDSRSQLENKKIALRRLTERIESLKHRQTLQTEHHIWTEHHTLHRGNPVKVIKIPL